MSKEKSEGECKSCKEEDTPLKGNALEEIAKSLDSNWQLVNEHHLCRSYEFEGWKDAVHFVNKIAELAEAENHHPDVMLSYGKVEVTLFTHKIDGLSENDFSLAAKIDQLG